jgi:predicted metalloprotease
MVFGALPQGKLCDCTQNFILRGNRRSCSDLTMRDEDIDKAADIFLGLWQENIRLWAAEKDMLTPKELAALLAAAGAVGSEDNSDA